MKATAVWNSARNVAGVVVSLTCFLTVIIGLSVPRIFVIMSSPSFPRNYRFGIRTVYLSMREGGPSLDFWDCQPSCSPAVTTVRPFLIAAFTFFIIGLCANAAQCIAFLFQMTHQPQSTARKATIGTGVLTSISYLIGSACAIGGLYAFIETGTDLPQAQLGMSSALFIAAWLGSVITIPLACSWRSNDTNVPWTTDGVSTGKGEGPATAGAEGNVADAPQQVSAESSV